MKYALAAVALAVLAKAQSISDLPSCAVPCLEDSVSENTDCDTDDAACICENFATVQGGAAGCILSECGSDTAIEEVLPAAEALCAEGGGSDGGDDDEDDSSSAAPPASTSVEPEPTTTYVTPEPTEDEGDDHDDHEEPEVTPPADHEDPEEPEQTPPPTGGAAAMGSVGGLAIAVLGALAL